MTQPTESPGLPAANPTEPLETVKANDRIAIKWWSNEGEQSFGANVALNHRSPDRVPFQTSADERAIIEAYRLQQFLAASYLEARQ